jgi:hypothetical protein
MGPKEEGEKEEEEEEEEYDVDVFLTLNDVLAHGIVLDNLCKKCIHPCLALWERK